jgi:hypothetical protein
LTASTFGIETSPQFNGFIVEDIPVNSPTVQKLQSMPVQPTYLHGGKEKGKTILGERAIQVTTSALQSMIRKVSGIRESSLFW